MQKISPFLWFDGNAEEAVNFYTSIFNNSKINKITKYPDTMPKMAGKVLNVQFELEGFGFMALDGGPMFKKTPAVSFFVNCENAEALEKLWKELSKDGKILMALDKYPFSEKYGWVEDRFGVSWQLYLGESEQKIIPCLMFVGKVNGKTKEAMEFYTTLFENSKVETTTPYGPGQGEKEDAIMHGTFTLSSEKFIAMDSGKKHEFGFTEGISLFVECVDQSEVDKLWEKLTAGGGKESKCGWLKDKYGVSWQIIPKALGELMSSPNKERSGKVMDALRKMKKITVLELERAYQE